MKSTPWNHRPADVDLFDHSHEAPALLVPPATFSNACPVLRCTGTIAVVDTTWVCDTCDWFVAASKSDQRCEELRTGTARYTTLREDLALLSIVFSILVVVGLAIWYFWRQM